MNQARVAAKLLFNGLRYRCLRWSGKPSRLQAISLEITHRCICRCCMCNIWRIPAKVRDPDLSVWTGLLSSPELIGLRELDITGGEPFLRQDLGELLCWIGKVHPDRFPRLRTVAITTNGILTDRILEVVGKVIKPLQELGVDLVLACGMDAIGDLHDRIRNTKGAWKALSRTLKELSRMKGEYPNLVMGIKTTVVPANVDELDKISSFAGERGLFTIISPCIITANRFGNTELEESLVFNSEQVRRMQSFFQGPQFAWSGHRKSLLDHLAGGQVEKPCSAGFNTVFVRHTGDVYPCPIIPFPLGNIQHQRLGNLLTKPQAARFRRRVGVMNECRTCTEPGLERVAWPFEGLTCLGRMIRMGRREFAHLSDHMGLEKYL